MNLEKIQALQHHLQENEIDWAYLSDPGHIAYFSGYHSEPHERILALFIPAVGEPFLFTPALEVQAASESSWSFEVFGYLDNEAPYQLIADLIKKRSKSLARFAFEKSSLNLKNFELFTQYFNGDYSYDLTPVIQCLQLIKTPRECELLLEAGSWADVAFEIGFKAIQAGATESEIVAEIEYQLKRRGVSHMSFDTIVLAGENAAKPHGNPGDTQVKPHEFVLFDLGVIWKGYCSDATRTVSYKEPKDFDRKIHEIVLEAQLNAQQAIKPGITAAELDAVARNTIASYGYGEYFTHRLGHGLGTTVHEFPSLVEGNDLVIEEGMCFSIEPGIYIPGKVGVRIEDCYYVTKDGAIPFTKTPKALQIIE
ncbi:aminopeptidase P family protein [Enterococcus nangangensis]